MLTSVLIANRGEIACRIIRTAKHMGIRTIAVYSDADRHALHVKMADEAHHIGPSPARESYLRGDVILDVAKRTKAACIHPGYGFLSENADFADACAQAGIVFVGPPANAIRAMGLKDAAKALVEKANVPVVPGYHGARQEAEFLQKQADQIGYPVLIKAVAGGGGKGMRKVESEVDFADALASAQREAASSFGDARVLVEKYITSPRHVEMQIFGDSHGNIVHLFERDCSLQRRHQKVIEEAPAPGMTPVVRAAMGKAAVEAAKAVGYVGAGTIEFIADGTHGLSDTGFYFMEMNTRLQVEHPVTEAITGLDLVELQFKVASGERLPFAQKDLRINGHAIEARVYAEDVEKGFLPSTGKLYGLRLPFEQNGVRVDTGVETGGEVTPFYDPMIAKVIAHGATRAEALDILSAALGNTAVAGPKTNTLFLKALCDSEGFRSNSFDTGFIDRNLVVLGVAEQPIDYVAATKAVQLAVSAMRRLDHEPVWRDPFDARLGDGFALMQNQVFALPVEIEGKPHKARVSFTGDIAYATMDDDPDVASSRMADLMQNDMILIPAYENKGRNYNGLCDTAYVVRKGRQTRVRLVDPLDVDLSDMGGGDGAIKAPMHGKLIAVLVEAGAKVQKGQKLAIVEAMKMEHALVAPRDGVVEALLATVGSQVSESARIIILQKEAE